MRRVKETVSLLSVPLKALSFRDTSHEDVPRERGSFARNIAEHGMNVEHK